MQIVPTLNFGGNCREAIHLYERAFNGKITCLITYGEARDPKYDPLLSEEQRGVHISRGASAGRSKDHPE